MIGFIAGRGNACCNGVVTLLVETVMDCAVGYEIHVNSTDIVFGQFRGYWVHEHAPQDAPHELYGFDTIAERDLFRRLLDIKGVGPKVAMRIVAAEAYLKEEFAGAPETAPKYTETRADMVSRLTKIRGVGATLAQRIVEAMS